MTVCFDLDGTLCTNTYGAYDKAEPFPWAIERLNDLAEAGHRIVVFTARGTATGIDWRQTTRDQLERWGVRYDDLQLGKPSADVYIDDRAVHTTAWREGDAYAVPGLGVPAPPGRPEALPSVLAPQRTTVVESGRTYAGNAFQAAEHIDRALSAATAAGIAEVPAADAVRTALDSALASSPAAVTDVVFSIALTDPVTAGFLDVADERVHAPLVTLRSLPQVAEGLRPLLVPADGTPAVRVPPGGLGGRLAAVVDGALALAPEGTLPRPLSAWLEHTAPQAGLAMASAPLEPAQLDRATEVFEAVAPFGLLRVAQVGDRPVATADEARARLTALLSDEVGMDVDRQLSEVLGQ